MNYFYELNNTNKLAPRLERVLELVYQKRPLLQYQVTHENADGGTIVLVYQDGYELGRINAYYGRYSPTKRENETLYAITCHNIRKSRGTKDTKLCSKADPAARAIIELFERKSMESLWQEMSAEARNMVSSLHIRVEQEFTGAINYNYYDSVHTFFTDMLLGKNPKLPPDIEHQLITKDVVRRRENFEIAENVAQHLKNNNGYVLRILKDETLLCANLRDSSDIKKHKSTYELEPFLQEKFTMLKLLDEKQFAADIGVRWEQERYKQIERIYFIVAGDTKVM